MKNLRHIALLFAVVTLSAFALAANPAIEEGLFLDGVEGVIDKVDKVDVWRFAGSKFRLPVRFHGFFRNRTRHFQFFIFGLDLVPCSVPFQAWNR